jgi:hypothetical protein
MSSPMATPRRVGPHIALPMLPSTSARAALMSAALVALVLMSPAALTPLAAQDSTRTPRDTAAARDTAAKDTARVYRGPVDNYALLPILGALVIVLGVAPSSLLLSPKLTNPGEGTLAFAQSHVVAYTTVGINYDDRNGWLHTQHVEVVRNGAYGELEVEQFYIHQFYRTETVRLGYLWHPKSPLAGGVTLGYRYATADSLQRGAEVGFPLAMGSDEAWLRFEPTYVVSARDGVCWNYRLQGEIPIGKTPYFSGFNFEAKALGRGDLQAIPITLLFGARF